MLAALVASGEAVFVLPFVIPRVFRPTVLDVLGVDNTQLGLAFSTYGTVAMAAYLLGGPLADRFSTRWMMTIALFATAVGGLYYASIPSTKGLVCLYGYWGVTTILLFWAGLLRATREWGGESGQGRAYGLLDGGRGLLAALLSSAAVGLFAVWLGPAEGAAPEDQRAALQAVILACSALTACCGAAIWVLLPDSRQNAGPRWRPEQVKRLVKSPAVWLQGLIVVCAYVGYKGTDDLSLLAADVLDYSDVEAATVGTLAFWIRPFAAISAGFLADRFGGWRIVAVGFGLLVISDLGVVFGGMQLSTAVLFTSIVGACVAVYALRGVYFALFRDASVPIGLTGTAVGLVSGVGYTPDIFFGPLMGWILDRSPGAVGHRDLFLVLAGFAATGLLATLGFAVFCRRTALSPAPSLADPGQAASEPAEARQYPPSR